MLSLPLAASSPAEPTPRSGAKQDEAWVRRDVHHKGTVSAAGTGVTKKLGSWVWSNLGACGCGVCSQEDGDLPAAGDSHQLHQGWERKLETFLSPDKPLAPAVSQPTRVSFHIWEQLSITYRWKTWPGKEENPYFKANKATMGSASGLWCAWQDPDRFSSLALHSHRSRAAALKALAPSSQSGFGVIPGAQETCTSGQKLAIHRAVLDDLR